MDEKFVNVVGDKIVIDGEWYKITNYDEVGEEVINMLKGIFDEGIYEWIICWSGEVVEFYLYIAWKIRIHLESVFFV